MSLFMLTKWNSNSVLALVSPALAHLSDSKLPKDEALRLLRVEMQRCLGSLKGKRQKIVQLQEELQLCQGRVNQLQTHLDEAKLSSSVRTKLNKNLNVAKHSASSSCQADLSSWGLFTKISQHILSNFSSAQKCYNPTYLYLFVMYRLKTVCK